MKFFNSFYNSIKKVYEYGEKIYNYTRIFKWLIDVVKYGADEWKARFLKETTDHEIEEKDK